MPKQAKSFAAKVRQIRQEYLDKVSATSAGNLRCNFCNVLLVKCDKKFFVESHRKTKQHQGKLETKSKSQSKQTFLQLDQVYFKVQVLRSFVHVAADILLHKLNHPSLQSLFATMGKVLTSRTAVGACVTKLASQKGRTNSKITS